MTDLPNPYSVNERKPLTNKQRLQMFIDAKGICALCGTKIGINERWTDEHIVPLWTGGSNQEWNRAPAHERCARSKTAKEAGERSRGRKFAENHFGAKRSRQPMPGSRNSAWKKTFAHGWVRRDET